MEIRFRDLGRSQHRFTDWIAFMPLWMGTQGGLSEQLHLVVLWCAANFDVENHRWVVAGRHILIRDEVDSVAFKLRWC